MNIEKFFSNILDSSCSNKNNKIYFKRKNFKYLQIFLYLIFLIIKNVSIIKLIILTISIIERLSNNDLHIDDNQEIKKLINRKDEIGIRLLEEFFNKENYQIEIAYIGEKAVEIYKNKEYDVILMDIPMPILDGIEATKIIRTLEKQINIYV